MRPVPAPMWKQAQGSRFPSTRCRRSQAPKHRMLTPRPVSHLREAKREGQEHKREPVVKHATKRQNRQHRARHRTTKEQHRRAKGPEKLEPPAEWALPSLHSFHCCICWTVTHSNQNPTCAAARSLNSVAPALAPNRNKQREQQPRNNHLPV